MISTVTTTTATTTASTTMAAGLGFLTTLALIVLPIAKELLHFLLTDTWVGAIISIVILRVRTIWFQRR